MKNKKQFPRWTRGERRVFRKEKQYHQRQGSEQSHGSFPDLGITNPDWGTEYSGDNAGSRGWWLVWKPIKGNICHTETSDPKSDKEACKDLTGWAMRFVLWDCNSGYEDKLVWRWPMKAAKSSKNSPSQKLY